MKSSAMNRLYLLTEWISKLAYLNLLWFTFSALGLIVFGIMPATVTLFSIIRRWLKDDKDIPIFKTFLQTYKQEFLKSNLIGIVLAVFYAIVVLDLHFLKVENSFSFVTIPLYLFIFAVVMTTIYIFPVHVHYDFKLLSLIKNSFLFMIINPITSMIIVLSLIITFYIMKVLPALIIFYGISFPAFLIMVSCYMIFERMMKKKETK
ncbi:YesL family protein [Bacillus andreraoultii]|uniref:YesL family protein n=1 Tax=Bacillus andreraoultii TaxID=1499685 RepID=UPI0009E4E5D7|nr:DUF624 domain-containing protein [Bacillus andreraoultii]